MSVERIESVQKKIYDLNTLIPITICKLLASGTILINMQWSKNHDVQLVGMGIATLFSFVFGYLVIISLNLGLTYQISRKKNRPIIVGIYYQRALLINFIICAFLVTPILFFSQKVIIWFIHIDNNLSQIIGEYLFQLVPSIYCFAYYDTTQTYLLAQEIYLAPLVINIFAVFTHYFMIQYIGAAWSKNLTDCGCCIAIYAYIVLRKYKIESWIQWTIKCIQGWSNHLKFLELIGLTTYIQSFFLFVFAIEGSQLERPSIICHICFLNLYQIFFLLNIGLNQGIMSIIGFQLKKQRLKISKKLGISTMKIFFIASLAYVFFMLIYTTEIMNFFVVAPLARQQFMSNYWILLLTLIIDSLKTGLSAILKSINKNYSVLKINLIFLILGCSVGYFFCYELKYGLIGLWEGWLFGSILHVLFQWMFLLKSQGKSIKKENNVRFA